MAACNRVTVAYNACERHNYKGVLRMEEKKSYFLNKEEAKGQLSDRELEAVAGGSTKPCLNCSSYDSYYGTANCPNSCYYKYFG